MSSPPTPTLRGGARSPGLPRRSPGLSGMHKSDSHSLLSLVLPETEDDGGDDMTGSYTMEYGSYLGHMREAAAGAGEGAAQALTHDLVGAEPYESEEFGHFLDGLENIRGLSETRLNQTWRAYSKMAEVGEHLGHDALRLKAARMENAVSRLWYSSLTAEDASLSLDLNNIEDEVERKLGIGRSFKRNISVKELLDGDFPERIAKEENEAYAVKNRTDTGGKGVLIPGTPTKSKPSAATAAPQEKTRLAAFGHSLERNGANNYLLYLVRELNRTGRFVITVFTPKEGPMREDYERMGMQVQYFEAGQSDASAHDAKLREILEDFDFVIINTIMAGPDVVIASAELGKPHFWVVHEAWPKDEFEYYAKEVFLMGHIDAKSITNAFAKAQKIIFPAYVQQQCYAGLFEDRRAQVIYNGIPTTAINVFKESAPRNEVRASLGYGPDDAVIAHPGTVCKRKNQAFTVSAFCDFCDAYPHLRDNAKLLLIGARYVRDHEIKYIDALKKEVKDRGLEDKVTILDTQKNMLPFYLACDVVLQPSLNEVLPLVICEAMAFSRPVIATRIDGIPEAIDSGNEGILIELGDKKSFADWLGKLVGDKYLRQKMGRYGRLRVREQFSFDKMMRTYQRLIKDLVLESQGELEEGGEFAGRGVVLVDMDNTLVDFDDKFLENWHSKNPLAASEHAEAIIERKHFELEANVPENLRNEVVDIIATPGFYRSLRPHKGALFALRQMVSEGWIVKLVTSPHPSCYGTCAAEKFDWVAENLGPEWVEGMIITRDKTLVKGDFLIDDKPKITGSCRNPDWCHVYFDQPYNRPDVVNAADLEDAPRIEAWTAWRTVIDDDDS